MSTLVPPTQFLRQFGSVYRFLAERGNALADVFPELLLTSWYRDAANNAWVGGSVDSQHLAGFAFDVDHPDPRAYPAIGQVAAQFGLVPVVEADHVHIQVFPASFGVVARLRDAGFLARVTSL